MKKFYKLGLVISLIAIAILSLNGCATLFKGSTDGVKFSSEPDGAKVYVNGDLLGKTPFALELKSNKSYTIEFRKDGYEPRTVLLNNSVGGGWVVLDILGGILPVVVDAATGNWYELDQEHVNAILETQHAAK